MRQIEIRGCRVRNLRNVDVDIPLHRLTVVTGVSGAGKSSLVFDTLAVEGQRRYIESFSVRDRKLLDRLERPDADRVDLVPPAITIRRRKSAAGPLATVAASTEILDGLQTLLTRFGVVRCLDCHTVVSAHAARDVSEQLSTQTDGARVIVTFSWPLGESLEERTQRRQRLLVGGYSRAIVDNTFMRFTETEPSLSEVENLDIVLDRLKAGRETQSRLEESLTTALRQGNGRATLLVERLADSPAGSVTNLVRDVDGRSFDVIPVTSDWTCGTCGRQYAEPRPQLLSFATPLGACATCSGTGIAPADAAPPSRTTPSVKSRRDSAGRTSATAICPDCDGRRFNDQALAVTWRNHSIADWLALSAETMPTELADVPKADDPGPGGEHSDSGRPLHRIRKTLAVLHELGLAQLPLDRSLNALSDGERLRLELAAASASDLRNTLIAIDEPALTLHPGERERLWVLLCRLRDEGNTVVVIEHDPSLLPMADYVIVVGPGAGRDGGSITFAGSSKDYLEHDAQPADSPAPSLPAVASEKRSHGDSHSLQLSGVRLQGEDPFTITLPVNGLTVVTGTSGSGAETLVRRTLYPACCDAVGASHRVSDVGDFSSLQGMDGFDGVIGGTTGSVDVGGRSTPATLLNVFDDIRGLFAETPEAKRRNLTPSAFSFNSSRGGRCPVCRGTGLLKMDLQFLPDLTMPCPQCGGTRYEPEVLEVRYRDQTIANVLDMTIEEAVALFRTQSRIAKRLRPALDLGLGYLTLGQLSSSLSGGELQRVQLAATLGTISARRTLIFLDEPALGLHPSEIARLTGAMRELIQRGSRIIAVSNSLDLMVTADDLVEIVPSAEAPVPPVVFTGPPADLARISDSPTGRLLRTTANFG